ncbi:Ig-like domain-containing protein, partial [Thalassolituus sp. C2-1]|uniref:beta strand repeat-containing protein n=1 Tax=Venatorbacter sp. C2-1 TaxID=2597518 RepID=UPI001195C20C
MKQFLFLLCFLPLVASAATQNSSLDSPGDVAILAYNGYDVSPSVIYNDGLTFLLVDDCPNGTTLTITDEEWDGTAFSTPTGEGNLTWTNNTGSTLARGTVIKITNASDDPSTSGITVNIGSAAESDTGFNMIDGDQLYIYTGTRAAPGVFLAFYGDESSLGNGDAATISGTSLVNGQTAQLNILQGYYIGPASCNSTLSDCLSQIYNTSNWSFTDNPSYPSNLPDTFTGSLFSTNNAPTAASFTASPVYQGTAYAFSTSDFSYSDTDGDPLNHIRIVTVPAQGSLWLDSDGSNTINGGESAMSNGSPVSKASIDAGYLKYLNTTGSSSSFTFDVNDGTEYSASAYTATLTVTAYPSITLSASSTSPAESAGSINLTATASHAFNQDITVNLSYSGTATSGVDYTQISSLVITTGNTTKTSALSISEDATEEVNETIIVDISTVSNGTESGTQQQTITIVDNDQTIPSVAISGASGTINAAFTATFTFSEDVTGFTVGDIVAGNASVSAFSATSASVYTALITPTTDGAVTVDVAGSVAQDGVGNNNTAATQLAVTYDGTAPTVAISGASGSINAPFTATFTFSENVTGFTVGDIVAGNASVSAFSATSASVYTALITPTADGSVTVDVAGSVAQDGVGNNNTAATQLAVTYDATAPTVAISGASGNINAAFTATFTFSENVTGFTVGDIVAGNASVSAFSATSASVYTALITPTADGSVTVDVAGSVAQDGVGNNNTAATQLAVTYDATAPTVAISGASGNINAAFTATFTFSENVTGFTVGDIVAGNASVSAFSATSASVYTALITPTADGAVTVDVAGATAQDAAGNNNTAAVQLAVTYDGTQPSVVISGASGSINAAFTATFTFSENVIGFTVGDIVAGNASVSAFSATSASVYTALITPTADGSVTVDVAGSVAQDGVGNNNTAATQLAVTYDATAPTVAISGASGNINAAFTATFTFSENVTGFTVGDIVAGNASVSAFSATSASVYTALITPTADGAVTVDVAGSVAQDAAGNNNTAAVQLTVTYDGTQPSVVISGASGSINAAFTATFTFSENVTGFTVGDIVAGNASVSAFSATSASVYTALITPTADGSVTVDVAGSVAQDGVGNNNTAATQLAVTYDATAPTVAISGASGSINAPFTATFTFSEAMSGITNNNYISVSNASVSAFNAISSSVYTALITPTADGVVTVDVTAGVVQDTAGNNNMAAAQLTVTYDATAPAVVITGASGSINSSFTATFTFSEAMMGITDNSYISVT